MLQALTTILTLGFGTVAGIAQGRQNESTGSGERLTVVIHANDKKLNGLPWDLEVIPTIGVLMTSSIASSAPDLAPVVFSEAGPVRMYHANRKNSLGVPYSFCPDKFVCRVEINRPSDYFAILALDLDYDGRHDFVMCLIFTPEGIDESKIDEARVKALDQQVRTWARNTKVKGVPNSPFNSAEASACTKEE